MLNPQTLGCRLPGWKLAPGCAEEAPGHPTLRPRPRDLAQLPGARRSSQDPWECRGAEEPGPAPHGQGLDKDGTMHLPRPHSPLPMRTSFGAIRPELGKRQQVQAAQILMALCHPLGCLLKPLQALSFPGIAPPPSTLELGLQEPYSPPSVPLPGTSAHLVALPGIPCSFSPSSGVPVTSLPPLHEQSPLGRLVPR